MSLENLDPPFDSYWGPITSNVDWCEPNYTHTRFVAEFWNTISNLPMIFLGLFGIMYSYNIVQHKKVTRSQRIANQADNQSEVVSIRYHRWAVGFFFLMLVGIGSTLFHMTLLYHYQLMDELPMILGSLVFVYVCFDLQRNTVNPASNVEKPSKGLADTLTHPPLPGILQRCWDVLVTNWALRAGILFVYGVITTVLMAMYTSSPLPMNISYLLLISFVVLRSYSIYRNLRSLPEGELTKGEPLICRIFEISLVVYLIGTIAWLTEKYFCAQLPFAKYLHMVWHIFAGSGTYLFIMWTLYVHTEFMDLNPELRFKYHFLPYIKLKPKQA